MLSFGAKPGTASILIPDHTHWGNEGPLLAKVSDGMGIQGWDRQHQYIKVSCKQLVTQKVLMKAKCYIHAEGSLSTKPSKYTVLDRTLDMLLCPRRRVRSHVC